MNFYDVLLAKNLSGDGGGTDIHGTVKEYLAGSPISAGDFVSNESIFLNNLNDTLLSDNTDRIMSADYLSDDRVFVVYVKDSTLKGQVFTVNNWEITAGTEVTLATPSAAPSNVSVVALSENKVLIAYHHGTGTSSVTNHLKAFTCSISEGDITIGTEVELSSGTLNANYPQGICTLKLAENKVFIAHGRANNSYLYGIVCIIDGTNITKGSGTDLTGLTSSGRVFSAAVLNENKVFFAYCHNSTNNSLSGVVCEVNGSTITRGSISTIVNTNYSGKAISAVALNENKVFIAHGLGSGADSTDDTLKGIVCFINGNSIRTGVDTVLQTAEGTGNAINVVPLNGRSVYIFHSHTDNRLYGTLCNIAETTISAGNPIQLLGTDNTANVICAISSNGKATVLHNLDDSLKAFAGETTISAFSTGNDILGVAKTSGNSGQIVQVCVPS